MAKLGDKIASRVVLLQLGLFPGHRFPICPPGDLPPSSAQHHSLVIIHKFLRILLRSVSLRNGDAVQRDDVTPTDIRYWMIGCALGNGSR